MNRRNLFTLIFKNKNVFWVKLILFGCCITIGMFSILPQYSTGYNAVIIDKVARLKSIDEPKIILIGNSNLAFGIDSKMIEEELGMPVVNMGLHGGLGNAFHEKMAKLNVHEGDIYILCHTNYDDDRSIGDEVLAWTTIENNYQLWSLLQPTDIFPMIKAFPTYWKKCVNLWLSGDGNQPIEGVYSRAAFNQYGDVVYQREELQYTFTDGFVPRVGEETITGINELGEYLSERGAHLLIAGYPIGKGDKTPAEEEYRTFQQKLAEKVKCPVISDFTDYMFEYSYFYDTEYHLNNDGVKKRTEQLILDIRKWMNEDTYYYTGLQ